MRAFVPCGIVQTSHATFLFKIAICDLSGGIDEVSEKQAFSATAIANSVQSGPAWLSDEVLANIKKSVAAALKLGVDKCQLIKTKMGFAIADSELKNLKIAIKRAKRRRGLDAITGLRVFGANDEAFGNGVAPECKRLRELDDAQVASSQEKGGTQTEDSLDSACSTLPPCANMHLSDMAGGDLLMIWDYQFNFSKCLGMQSPFTLHDFVNALALGTEEGIHLGGIPPRTMVTDFCLSLLRVALGRSTRDGSPSVSLMRAAAGDSVSVEAMPSVRKLLGGMLNSITWPEILRRLLEAMDRYGTPLLQSNLAEGGQETSLEKELEDSPPPTWIESQPGLKQALWALARTEFRRLEMVDSLTLLRCLVDMVAGVRISHEAINARMDTQVEILTRIRRAEATETATGMEGEQEEQGGEGAQAPAGEVADTSCEELRDACRSGRIRNLPIGVDGQGRKYWYFPGDGRCLHIQGAGPGSTWGYVKSEEGLAQLCESLNKSIPEEAQLIQQVEAINEEMFSMATEVRTRKAARPVAATHSEEPRRSLRVRKPRFATLDSGRVSEDEEDATSEEEPDMVLPPARYTPLAAPWTNGIIYGMDEHMPNLKLEMLTLQELVEASSRAEGDGSWHSWRQTVKGAAETSELVGPLLELEAELWSAQKLAASSSLDWNGMAVAEGEEEDFVSPYDWEKGSDHQSKQKPDLSNQNTFAEVVAVGKHQKCATESDRNGSGDGASTLTPAKIDAEATIELENEAGDDEADVAQWEAERDSISLGPLEAQLLGCLSESAEARAAWREEVANAMTLPALTLLTYGLSSKAAWLQPFLKGQEQHEQAVLKGVHSANDAIFVKATATGEVVWARLRGWSWWPALVMRPESKRLQDALATRSDILLTFMGEVDQFIVNVSCAKPFVGDMERDGCARSMPKGGKKLQKAISMGRRALRLAYEAYGSLADPNAPANRAVKF